MRISKELVSEVNKERLTDELVLEGENFELRVDGDPDVESECRGNDDDEHHPGPVANVQTDEEVGRGDGAGGDSRSEFPNAEIATGDGEGGGERINHVGHEERDERLVETVQHEEVELEASPLEPEDATAIELGHIE